MNFSVSSSSMYPHTPPHRRFHLGNATEFSSSLFDGPIQFPWYHVQQESVFPGISDKFASLLGNVLAYWVVSMTYHFLDISGWKWLEKYRNQSSEEVLNKNLVTKGEVVRSVALQQVIQATFGYVWLTGFDQPEAIRNHAAELRRLSQWIASWAFTLLGDHRGRAFTNEYNATLTYNVYWWIVPILQFILALFILDTYQYFLHRTFHEVKFLYKHFHSMHHRLYVPFAFGALYGHPFEGAILDGLGATLAHTLAGMSDRQAILFFAFATYKTVDDHCGYYFPWYPLHMIFGNNSQYHDIHHQHAGIKWNYSQPLFIHWDVILGTRMTIEQLRAKKSMSKVKQIKSQ